MSNYGYQNIQNPVFEGNNSLQGAFSQILANQATSQQNARSQYYQTYKDEAEAKKQLLSIPGGDAGQINAQLKAIGLQFDDLRNTMKGATGGRTDAAGNLIFGRNAMSAYTPHQMYVNQRAQAEKDWMAKAGYIPNDVSTQNTPLNLFYATTGIDPNDVLNNPGNHTQGIVEAVNYRKNFVGPPSANDILVWNQIKNRMIGGENNVMSKTMEGYQGPIGSYGGGLKSSIPVSSPYPMDASMTPWSEDMMTKNMDGKIVPGAGVYINPNEQPSPFGFSYPTGVQQPSAQTQADWAKYQQAQKVKEALQAIKDKVK